MIPRFRVWDRIRKTMYEADDVNAIIFDGKDVCVQTVYFEDGLPVSRDVEYCDFDDIELMQSTGMLDKNWREIFEGDIIAINLEGIETPITAKVFQNRKIGILMFHCRAYRGTISTVS